MFGEPDLNIEELDTETQQEIRKEALATEVKSVEKETGTSHPAGDKTHVIVSKTPVATGFGIPEGMVPESEGIKEKDPEKTGGFITRFYYTCKTCGKQTQNRASMFTHACKCLNIYLVCAFCQKTYQGSEYIKKHIDAIHGSK